MAITLARIAAAAASASCLALLALPGASWAEGKNPFVGQWSVGWTGPAGAQQADLDLTDKGGYWKTLSAPKDDPCSSREVPVRYDLVGSQEISLTVLFSVMQQGCKDSKVNLVRYADGRVSGLASGGQALAVQRKN